MKIKYIELDIHEVENFQKDILDEINSLDIRELELDFMNVIHVDLCFIQTLISVKKYCNNSDIDLVIKNIDSNEFKQYIKVLNLNQTLGIMND